MLEIREDDIWCRPSRTTISFVGLVKDWRWTPAARSTKGLGLYSEMAGRNILALTMVGIIDRCEAHIAYLEPLLADSSSYQQPSAAVDVQVHICTDMELTIDGNI